MKRGLEDKEQKIELLQQEQQEIISNLSKKEVDIAFDLLQPTFAYLKAIYNDDMIYDDIALDNYFNRMIKQIDESNPLLSAKTLKLYIIDSPYNNAFTVLDDRIYVNIGLIGRMENEGQLAFVLCHELAHYVKDHSSKFVDDYIDFWSSEKTKRKINQIKTASNRGEAAREMLENYKFDHRSHARYNEFEADSLGYTFFINAGYDPKDAIAVMDVLDKNDELSDHTIPLMKFIDSKSFPVNEFIKKEEDMALGDFFRSKREADKTSKDAKKWQTHPDIKKRKAKLELWSNNTNSKPKSQTTTDFEGIHKHAKYEMILSYMNTGEYDIAFNLLLIELDKNERDVYLIYLTAVLLSDMHDYLKDYNSSKLLPPRSYFLGEHHESIYKLMKNATPTAYADWAFHFLDSNYTLLEKNEKLLEEWNRASKNFYK